MYRFLIVEDEEAEAARLHEYIERYAARHHLEIAIDWEKTAFNIADSRKQHDLVFMDIGLPGISGMEAAELMRTYDNETIIIFVTTLAQYAMRGYEVGALDFMLKPVTFHAVSMRLDRAIRILDRRIGKSLYLATKSGARVVPLSSLEYVEVSNHDLLYHLANDDEPLVIRGTMSKLVENLGGGSFIRISNSCVVNADYIRKVEGADVTMASGAVLPMSRSKHKMALEELANYFGGNR